VSYHYHEEKDRRVYENLKLLDATNRPPLNAIRIHPAESREHFLKKCEICFELYKTGCTFVTEALFPNGGRADIIDLSSGTIFEIAGSEGGGSIYKKWNSYPKTLRFKVIRIKREEG
jgi:hypothetical protein